jgi:hypothetical protein
MSPVLKFPLVDVMVWATWSWLVTVTVAPGATVMVLGAKEKFLIVMASFELEADVAPDIVVGVDAALVVGVVLPELEHAASTSAVATRTPMVR